MSGLSSQVGDNSFDLPEANVLIQVKKTTLDLIRKCHRFFRRNISRNYKCFEKLEEYICLKRNFFLHLNF